MGARLGSSRWTAVALAVAVAVAGLGGFLISRPQSTRGDTTRIGSPALAADTLASTIGYTAAADPASKQVVVFGGDLTLAQTWLWSGNRWKLAHPRTSPSGREEAAAAYDPVRHMVLLFGGIQPPETFLGDTWGWDGSTWHLLDSGASGPPPGQASMAWDPALDTMVLMPASSSGADTWTWSGTHWIDHRQPDPYLPTGVLDLAYNPATQVLVGVGFGSVVSGGYGAPTETWTWNGARWSQLSTRVVPSAYGFLGLGWDPISAKLLLFGEGPATLIPLLRWEWSGTDWVELPSLSGPSVIEGHVTGGETSTLLLVGELSEANGATPIRVWSWDGTAWGQPTSTTVPPATSASPQPALGPCGYADCSSPQREGARASCDQSTFRALVTNEIDGSIEIGGSACDGNYLVLDLGHRICATTVGAPCLNSLGLAFFVAQSGKWSLISYGRSLTCASVGATLEQPKLPASLCTQALHG